MATKLSMTSEICFCFNSCSVAMAFVTAPFDIALIPAFMAFDFMGGRMVRQEKMLERSGRVC